MATTRVGAEPIPDYVNPDVILMHFRYKAAKTSVYSFNTTIKSWSGENCNRKIFKIESVIFIV